MFHVFTAQPLPPLTIHFITIPQVQSTLITAMAPPSLKKYTIVLKSLKKWTNLFLLIKIAGFWFQSLVPNFQSTKPPVLHSVPWCQVKSLHHKFTSLRWVIAPSAHASPTRVREDILHELPISHICCINLKKNQIKYSTSFKAHHLFQIGNFSIFGMVVP